MTQLFAARTVVASTIKHRVRWCCRDLPLPTDAAVEFNNASSSQMMRPQLHDPLPSDSHPDGEPTSPQTPITATASSNMLPTNIADVAHALAGHEPVVNSEVHVHDAPGSDVSHKPRPSTDSDSLLHPAVPNAPHRSVQSSLHRFFGRRPIDHVDEQHDAIPQVKRTLYTIFSSQPKNRSLS